MLPAFLTRPILRLRADGGVDAPGPREAALGRPTLLLARGLCRFERFRPPAGLTSRAGLAAARLHARTRAPFAAAGHALARTGLGYGVWWWDAGHVDAALSQAGVEGPVRLRPEAAAQAVEDGWRVLRGEGYEAQNWVGSSLEASAWRRTPFDAAAWRTLVRLAPDGLAGAPPSPPPARPALFVAAAPYAARFVREIELRALLPSAAAAMAAVGLGASAFFLGQGLTAARRDGALRAEIAAREAAPAASRRPELAARARGLDALARVTDSPGPLARLLQAQRLLARFDLAIVDFDAQRDQLSVSVPASAAAGVDLLVEELQATRVFADVRPILDRDAHVLTLHMRVVAG